MAKMFYTLEEAAEKLALDVEQVKAMAAEGKLQQFRDRDKLMFKREQVDQLAAGGDSGIGDDSIGLDDTSAGTIPLAGDTSLGGDDNTSGDTATNGIESLDASGDTNAIDIKDDSFTPDQTNIGDTSTDLAETGMDTSIGMGTAINMGTSMSDAPSPVTPVSGDSGIDVFDTDEVDDTADPAAQTQVTQEPIGEDDDLSLESVGSGSGLLDLTRESDDTSLGAAELLEEISSGGSASVPTESALGVTGSAAAVGSSGAFESAIAMESSQAASSLEQAAIAPEDVHGGAAPSMAAHYEVEADDPAGSGFGAGMLLGAMIALILGLIVIIGWIGGVQVPLARMMAASSTHLFFWTIGLIAASLAFGVVGTVIGKAAAAR